MRSKPDMSRPRILVLTALHLCRNPRVVKEATALGSAGYDVTVMTVSLSERFERMDRKIIHDLPFTRVTLDYAAVRPATQLRGFLSRGATWCARAAQQYLGIESPQALGPAHELMMMAKAFPADLTIAHTEIPIWAAQHLIRHGRRVAVDLEDWYSEDLLYADRLSRPLRLLRQAERFALNRAVYSSATSDSMADALATAYDCPRPLVIRNTFPLQLRTRLDRPASDGAPSFVWFSQTVGPGRGLEQFFSAWNLTKNPSRVVLIGDTRSAYQKALWLHVAPDRRDRISFVSPVSPAELPDKLAEFDIGLALESHWPLNRNITITNKIIQYLNAGLALVATDTAGQCEVMRVAPDSGLLVQAHETAQFAAQLDELVSNRDRLRACQHAARAAAAVEFSWERESKKLLEAVERALTGVSPRPMTDRAISA